MILVDHTNLGKHPKMMLLSVQSWHHTNLAEIVHQPLEDDVQVFVHCKTGMGFLKLDKITEETRKNSSNKW